MTLAGRLSLFFLAALAVVLAGFSASLFFLARFYLLGQADARAAAALDALTAAVEFEAGGLEWDAAERRLPFGRGASGDDLAWSVSDESGRPLDGTPGAAFLADDAADADEQAADVVRAGAPWRVLRRRLHAAPSEARAPHRHGALLLAVGLPLAPVRGSLRLLGGALAALSVALWLTAAALGRRLCRRALAPVGRMARAARAITAADLARRLPLAGTGDELDDLGRAFNDLLTRLQDAFERQRRFTGEASHQLRTPLAGMLGQVEVALRRPREPEEYRRTLDAVRHQAERLRRLVEMLLFLARADAEARLPELATFDLATWLLEHRASWAGHPRAADFRWSVAGGPLGVRAHPELLAQALDNLLDNAAKYSAAGAAVAVSAGRDENGVWLAVEDGGCGVGPEDLPHLGEPFFRTAEARRRGVGGVGLGLAVAARIATALGGRLAIDSKPGRGSRFALRLPAAAVAVQAGPPV